MLTAGMGTGSIYDIRRGNLAWIIDRRFAGLQGKFAAQMGYEPSMVSRLLSTNLRSQQNIGSRMARKIEATCGAPEHWLDTAHPENELRQDSALYNVELGPSLQREIPLISWVQAGNWQDVIDNLPTGQGEKWVATTARVGPHAYALRIVGDSMTNPNGAPSFPEGITIIVDPDREASTGKFVVVRQNSDKECTFKQLVRDGERYYLRPLNPRYPILELAQDAVICGVLVQAVMDF